jgi:hypothetical protein
LLQYLMRHFLILAFCLAHYAVAQLSTSDDALSFELDRAVFSAYPEAFAQLARSFLPTDDSGLVGRNREWGGMYSPRFQLGAGATLRYTLSTNNTDDAKRAFRAVQVGAEAIEEDGTVPSSVPADLFPTARVTSDQLASGAAFFLGDACLGILALESYSNETSITTPETLESVKAKLAAATQWLVGQANTLQRYDEETPNRLFFDALAFQACGRLALNDSALTLANDFARAGLELFDERGFFIEAGGHDTSYQAVALQEISELLVAGNTTSELQETLLRAAQWLAGRVRTDGSVDSEGNTRTCSGGESFLGESKRLSVVTVFIGLATIGIREQDAEITSAAERVVVWLKSNPRTNPCFED